MGLPAFPLKKILILIVILAVPGLLYYLLEEKGENRYRPLAIFGPKQVASTYHIKRGKKIPDTVYHQVNPFKLVNEAGKTVSYPPAETKITVVNFFYTRCPLFCRNMNKQMARVAQTFGANQLLQFYSVTLDGGYDTPERLMAYGAQFPSERKNWNFLTGDTQLVHNLARKEFLLDAQPDSLQKNNIIHSPMLVLVDPQRRIRGYYDSGDEARVDELIDEIKVLITEELRKIK